MTNQPTHTWRATLWALLCISALWKYPLEAQELSNEIPKPLASFLEQHCSKCHDAENKKGDLDLAALPFPTKNPDTVHAWTEIFDRVAEQEMPPPNKTQPQREARLAFLKLLKKDLQTAALQHQKTVGRVQARRLTRSEFERSVQDLLGIYIPLQSHLPEDPITDGFTTVASGQQVSANQLETYMQVVDEALENAFKQALQPRETWEKLFTWQDLQRHNVSSVNISRGPEGRPQKNDVVSWSAKAGEFYGRMEATKVPADGWYKIRLRALAVNPPKGERISASVFGGRHVSSSPVRYLIGAVEASESAEDFEFFAWMNARDLLRVQTSDNTLQKVTGHKHKENREMLEDLDGKGFPGIAVQSVQIERVYPAFAPEDTQRILFGDLISQAQKSKSAGKPLAATKNKSGTKKAESQTTGKADLSSNLRLEIAPENPQQDFERLVLTFANRAFRLPVKSDEIQGYVQLALEKLKSGASFADSLRTSYRAILMSPRFYFLEEAPGPLTSHALSTRLSLFLWGMSPDAELRSLADSGKLLEPAVLHAQVDRMLLHGNAKRFIRNFTDQWLKLREIDATNPDEKLYGEFDDLLKHAMLDETQTFFWDLIKRDLSVKQIVDSDFTFVNNRLAKHYGLPPLPAPGVQQVALKPENHRGGLITHASILKVTANGTTTSPVVRGVWMLERIAGLHVPPPPPSVPAIEPDIRGAKTIREQLDKHRSQESCASCHVKMDPPGFALENYDVIGGWRENYRAVNAKGTRIQGPKVDASYHFKNGEGFSNLNEYKLSLLDRPDLLAKNLVQQLLTFSTGASPGFADREAIEAIVIAAKQKDYGVRTLIHGLIQSPLFLNK